LKAVVQDIDNSVGASSLPRMANVLNEEKKQQILALGLYTDHLIHALAYRVQVFARNVSPSHATRPASGLPNRILKRVLDKMRVLDDEVSLQSLAQVSGYSRVHFLRMFRAATGRSPHNYLMNMRVERARELLSNSAFSLIEIALECGFSSHSHMTRVFRQFLGVTPSEYRRGL